MADDDGLMGLGGLFDDEPAPRRGPVAPVAPPLYGDQKDHKHSGAAAVVDTSVPLAIDASAIPPPSTLNRQLSLSKNSIATLEARLKQLHTDEADTIERADKRIAQLHAEIERERIELSKYRARMAVEGKALVAAIAKHAHTNDEANTASGATKEEALCAICLEKRREAMLAPCGHIALCHACATGVKASKNPECPFCRQKIVAVYKCFFA